MDINKVFREQTFTDLINQIRVSFEVLFENTQILLKVISSHLPTFICLVKTRQNHEASNN